MNYLKQNKKIFFLLIISLLIIILLIIGLFLKIHFPNSETDFYAVGKSKSFESISDVEKIYNDILPVHYLDYKSYPNKSIVLYYDEHTDMNDVDNWNTLMISLRNDDEAINAYCIFNTDCDLNDFRVTSVFNRDSTQKYVVGETNVETARLNHSIENVYMLYSLFIYKNVIYDIRTQSDNKAFHLDVLKECLE